MYEKPNISNSWFEIPGFSIEMLGFLFEILGLLFEILVISKIRENRIPYTNRANLISFNFYFIVHCLYKWLIDIQLFLRYPASIKCEYWRANQKTISFNWPIVFWLFDAKHISDILFTNFSIELKK